MPEDAANALRKILLENKIYAQVKGHGVYIPYARLTGRKIGFMEASLPIWIDRVIKERQREGISLAHRMRFGAPNTTVWRAVHFTRKARPSRTSSSE